MAAGEVGEIEVGQFVRRLRGLVDRHPDFRIVWFLGAGCSVTSGIPTAAGLVSPLDAATDEGTDR